MMLRESIVTQCANNALHAFVADSNQFEYGKNSLSVAAVNFMENAYLEKRSGNLYFTFLDVFRKVGLCDLPPPSVSVYPPFCQFLNA
jgi:hypothetical protein